MSKRQLNFLSAGNLFPCRYLLIFIRAYVVHTLPESVKTEPDKAMFSENVKKWIRTKVAQHKFLRGGELLRRYSPSHALSNLFNSRCCGNRCHPQEVRSWSLCGLVVFATSFSAAGKILRRELRYRAKEELAGRDPYDNRVNAKL